MENGDQLNMVNYRYAETYRPETLVKVCIRLLSPISEGI